MSTIALGDLHFQGMRQGKDHTILKLRLNRRVTSASS